ncbi:MAG: diguanylate cyclase [Devosia sp.]
MIATWQALIGNFALVGLFISLWVHGQFLLADKSKLFRHLAFGTVMGVGAIASMLMAPQLQPGVLFDLRSSMIAIAGFFGGPAAAIVAIGLAIICRLILGGAGTVAGSVGIVAVALAAIAISKLTRNRLPALVSCAILALAVMVVGPIVSTILVLLGFSQVILAYPPVLIMNAAATMVSGFFIMRQRVSTRESDLFRAAFMQSPDFHYVKTPDNRFAAVNNVVAKHHGYTSPAQLQGKTDADIEEPERARELLVDEQRVLATGEGFAHREEVVTDLFGSENWYSTSKVPLRDADGEIIGLSGVTHDITRRKRLETELTQSRNRLDYVLSGVSDGIALFDSQGTLAYANDQYRDMFPMTSDVRRSGQHIRDILAEVVARGEQVIPAGQEQEWIDEIAASLKKVSEEEVQLFDGHWLQVRTKPTKEGSALVMVTDITKVKQAESALKAMTEQLKLLATTDGLTGLTNRRAFDAALESEIARSRRNGHPMSVLMVDVDRFKTYNDLYGHQSGDDVLRKVAQSLRDTVRRPGDVAARYGGEEFVAILPNTDEDGAFFIADAFRETLRGLGIEHKGGDKGVLTASVGLATFTERDAGTNANELVRRADEALYNAKAAGRDRVTGWRPKYDVRPVGGMRA